MLHNKVLIVGGSGLLGRAITRVLNENNISVVWLGRTESTKGTTICYRWDYKSKFIDKRAFEGVSVVINLAGAGIADKRWTSERKKEIYESRVEGTKFLFDYISQHNIKLMAYVSSSGTGYYGSNVFGKIVNENDSPGTDFLAKICVDWEKEANRFKSICRTVIIRTGVVLSKNGGAYPKIRLPILLGLGSPIGTGKQYLSWIHEQDISHLYLKAALDTRYEGAINGVAPEAVSNENFTKIIANHLNRWMLPVNIPAWVIKLFFGEMAITVLGSLQVSNKKLNELKFEYKYPNIEDAIMNLECQK
jgi:uncharacterized protein (TIGR01777 family)